VQKEGQDNSGGNFGLRAGPWKLVRLKQRGRGLAHFAVPGEQNVPDPLSQATVSRNEPAPPAGTHSLYRLTDDSGERHEVSAAHPDIVRRLTEQLDKIIAAGRTRAE
jgi:hypothetical protein